MFNFMDRQILSILQEPIRAEFGLSDSQLGLLTGLSFAIFYTTCGLPVARFADRYRRIPIMAGACAVWSLFTALSGFAQSFTQLLLARLMVGAGEAGGSPPAYSVLSDYFPPRERGTAMGLYSLGVPAGSALGIALGGWVAANFGWRLAFIAVGLPGVVLALLMLLLIKEPRRGRLDADDGCGQAIPMVASIRAFFSDPVMTFTALAAAMSAFVGYGLLSWNPSFLVRVKGMAMADIAVYYSIVIGLTGVVGIFGAGLLADRLGRRDERWYAWLPAIAFAGMIPGIVGAIYATGWLSALCWLTIPALLINIYVAPALAVVQNRTPPERRTMASATLLFVINLIGLGGGPLYVGAVSDLFGSGPGEGSLLAGYAALIPAIAITVVLHILTSRAMRGSPQAALRTQMT